MKSLIACLILCVYSLTAVGGCKPAPAAKELKIILLRHGEKPDDGDNLSCSGYNRSLKLAGVLYSRYGIPDYIYVPAPGQGKRTKNCRMLQTIMPFAIKHNLTINTSHAVAEIEGLVHDLKKLRGTVVVVWEHRQIPAITEQLGVKGNFLNWEPDDYDSIWIVQIRNGSASLTMQKEGIKPAADCAF
jgi:hypothetical protein